MQEGKSIGSATTNVKGTATINIANYNGKLVSITTSLAGYQSNTIEGTALSNGKSINISLIKGTGSATTIVESKVESIYSKSEDKVNKIGKKAEHHVQIRKKRMREQKGIMNKPKKQKMLLVSANDKTEGIRKKAEEARKKANEEEKMQIKSVRSF